MDPLERAIDNLEKQKKLLLEEREEHQHSVNLGSLDYTKPQLKQKIQGCSWRVQAIDYVLTFLENENQ